MRWEGGAGKQRKGERAKTCDILPLSGPDSY